MSKPHEHSGLSLDHAAGLDAIGAELGVCPERARQIIERAMVKFRRAWVAQEWAAERRVAREVGRGR